MSILIKGMEMPKHSALDGEKDTFYKGAIAVHKDGTAEMVIFRESAHVFALCNKIHLDKFSLVEVPTPHGRLIDAEKLAVKIWTEGHFVTGNDCEIAVDFTQSAPTIIEAEASEL